MHGPAAQCDRQPQERYFNRILQFIGPESGYLFVINQRPYKIQDKVFTEKTVFVLEEILQLPEHGQKPDQRTSTQEELLPLLTAGQIVIKDPEESLRFLAHRLAIIIQPGDVIVTTSSGTRREVIKAMAGYNGLLLKKNNHNDCETWDVLSVVTGLNSGIISVERVST